MQDTLSGLVASYGYVVLFFLVGLESLGIPLPGETALVTAAAVAALGHLSICAVVATAGADGLPRVNRGLWGCACGGTSGWGGYCGGLSPQRIRLVCGK